MTQIEPSAVARGVLDANRYMVLSTVGADGAPWASPVWFAHDGLSAFLWLSRANRRHSQNIAERPRIALVVFDSTVAIGDGQAVYAEAEAAQVGTDGLEPALELFNERSARHQGRSWTAADVSGEARLRLYRAEVTAMFVLDEDEDRIPV